MTENNIHHNKKKKLDPSVAKMWQHLWYTHKYFWSPAYCQILFTNDKSTANYNKQQISSSHIDAVLIKSASTTNTTSQYKVKRNQQTSHSVCDSKMGKHYETLKTKEESMKITSFGTGEKDCKK